MDNSSVFEYQDYKKFLLDLFDQTPKKGRGEKAKLARTLGCHTGYVSQVLNGGAHFSLEQTDQINLTLGHSSEESHFFMLLVQLARAGTESLRTYFQSQMTEILNQRRTLKNRMKFERTLNAEEQSIYYSAWYYCAVHTLIAIPQFQTRDEISSALGLSVEKTGQILSFLEARGLIVLRGNKYHQGVTTTFLDVDSPWISKHHSNWRTQALIAMDNYKKNQQMHYSAVITIAKEDIAKVRNILLNSVEGISSVVDKTSSESLYCYSLDLFPLLKK